jgi:hypothetical protein
MRGLKTRWLVIAILAILTLYGLLAGFMYSLNYDLSSDTVVPGIVAMEIFTHGNLQFNYPANDPYLFTDIFTFHLIPQLISGYDPTVLKLTAFAMFIIAVLVFSYIVYKYSGLINALMFAALLSNLSPEAYTYFITPEWHIGTLLLSGVFIILLDFDRIDRISIYQAALLVIAVALVLISDSIILAIFIIPYVVCYILFKKLGKKNADVRPISGKKVPRAQRKMENSRTNTTQVRRQDMTVLSVAVVPFLALLFKMYEPVAVSATLSYFNPTPVSLVSLSQSLTVNLPLYFQCLSFLVCHGLYDVLSLRIGLTDLPLAVLFLATLGIAIVMRNRKAGVIYTFFLTSALVIFLGVLFTSLTDGFWSARFLTFTAVSIFAVIALAYDEMGHKGVLNVALPFLVIVLVLSNVPASEAKMLSIDNTPNQAQYSLIGHMESTGYQYGFSDYNQANVLTYLSKETLIVRAIDTNNDQIIPYSWLASNKWYTAMPSKFFIISENGTDFDSKIQGVVVAHSPSYTESYEGYTIYYYNSSE